MKDEPDNITLKWGTLKSWYVRDPKNQAILQKYFDQGVKASAMTQKDTTEQKQILCELIESIGKPVYLDWDGEYVSVEDAKKYVMEYNSD